MRQAVIGGAVLSVLASACAATAVQEAAPPVATVEEPVFTARPGLSAQELFRAALSLLETGNAGEARAHLIAYLEENPRSAVASDLLRQIEADSREYYPSEYREIALMSGESLSTLAQRYLGDVYQFYALAKYNDIVEPRQLRAGQTLRIPLTAIAIAAFAADDDPEATAREVAATAEAGAAEAAAEAEAPAEALPQPAPALARAPDGNPADLHREALNAFRAHNLEQAISLWDQVLVLDPEHENAGLYRAQAVKLQNRLQQLN
ncbi:LysM domain-containing protein [Haliea sp. E1-2-M8]|uniref:LysM peptidoglycan-binding domain-containing protein n=1 Tax=Haliea sp. E1-2-M8 TaxID=3064706 RepID=UPI00271FF46F|nr:LysM domain-containing protein [Haliea sp. E1-2-M8]MDO8862670.1 LysM domain-containing protein [Haliea sp. E1-2-M8]